MAKNDCDENDDGQNLKREDHADRAALAQLVAEDELAAGLRITEHGVHPVADGLEHLAEPAFAAPGARRRTAGPGPSKIKRRA